MTIKAQKIQDYINSGETEIDVTTVEGICNAFTGEIVGNVKTDTDGSYYITVRDAEDNHFDVHLSKVDLP